LKKLPEHRPQAVRSFASKASKLFQAVKKPHEDKGFEKQEDSPVQEAKTSVEKNNIKPEVASYSNKEDEKRKLLEEAEKFLAKDKLKEAEECYIKILKLDQKDVAAYKGLGKVYLKRKKYKYALEIFQKLVELSPKEAASYCNLGMCFFKKKNFKKAKESYEKAVVLEEKPAYYKNLALALNQLKSYEKAASVLEKSLKKYGKDEELIMLMMKIIPKIKDKKKIKGFVNFLLGLDPDNTVLKRELSRLI